MSCAGDLEALPTHLRHPPILASKLRHALNVSHLTSGFAMNGADNPARIR
jgi:hypothetical protein